MKSIKLSAICAAALLLAIPFAGCGQGDSGNVNMRHGVELTQEAVENGGNGNGKCPNGNCDDDCRDGDCDENCEDKDGGEGECPDGKCPNGKCEDGGHRGKHRGRRRGRKCPDGKCPKTGGRKPLRKEREAKPLPCPIDGNN